MVLSARREYDLNPAVERSTLGSVVVRYGLKFPVPGSGELIWRQPDFLLEKPHHIYRAGGAERPIPPWCARVKRAHGNIVRMAPNLNRKVTQAVF